MHKNVRTFQMLERLGGDVLKAKRWVLKDSNRDMPDDFDQILASTKWLKKFIEKPGGRAGTKLKDELKDEIRAAKVALAVAMAENVQRKLAPPGNELDWAQLSHYELCALVQLLLPAPLGKFDGTATHYDGVAAIQGVQTKVNAHAQEWRDFATLAIKGLGAPLIKAILIDEGRDVDLKAQVLKNNALLSDEIESGISGFGLDETTHLSVLSDGADKTHAICVYSLLETDTGGKKKETVVKIDSLLTHPCNILNIRGADHRQLRGTAAALLKIVEDRARNEFGCTLAYLDAGTQDVENYYATKHEYQRQDTGKDQGKRRRAGSVSLDAENTLRISADKVNADHARNKVMARMVKKL